MNKENNIWSTAEDWKRFVNDAYKYATESRMEYIDIRSLCEVI